MIDNLAAVMVTVDRAPQLNYLAETMENLHRSDLDTSGHLHSFTLVDSGPGAAWAGSFGVAAIGAPERRCANLNVAAALRHGAGTGAPWVLFLEDDIDVCARFFDSVALWLYHWSRPKRHVYAFGTTYPELKGVVARGDRYWDYPIGYFYGTQAFAIRAEDALDLAAWLEVAPYARNAEGVCYDLIMHTWAQARWPRIRCFLASAPSFVQHIGRTSIIAPRKATHTFPTWPGRDWSYAEAA